MNDNQDGCPDWCIGKHDGLAIQQHRNEVAGIRAGEPGNSSYLFAWASIMEVEGKQDPGTVRVHGWQSDAETARASVDPESARGLAAIIGMLADATPEQHRELSAEIGTAADLIDPPQAPEAEAG
jgi:Domain of unknown function (DUF6907)